MAFQPVTNGVETIVKGQLDDEDAFVTLGWLGTPGFGQGAVASLANAVGNWWVTEMLPDLPSQYVYRETVARDLRSASGFEATSVTGQGTLGGLIQPASPNNVTIAISFRTGLIGRSNRGRNYIPGITEADVAANEVSAVRLALWRSAYALLIGDGSLEADFTWGVISRRTGGALRPAGIVVPIVAVTFTDNIVDSQRRRLPGRGD